MLLPFLTLATPPAEIEKNLQVEFMSAYDPSCRLTEGMRIPVITHEANNKVILMAWGKNRGPGRSSPVPWTRVEGIITQNASKILVRTHRCVILTNCFYSKRPGSLYLFYHPGQKIMLLAGIWCSWKSADNSTNTYFTVITRSAPEALRNYAARVPVILQGSGIRKYLNIGLPLMDITRILNDVRYPRLNGYMVNAELADKTDWRLKDLLPHGARIFGEQPLPDKLIFRNWYYFR